MKRILVTGANSYVGNAVEAHLAQWPEKYNIHSIDMHGNQWRDSSFAGYDSVFHVAGIAHQSFGNQSAETRQRYIDINTHLAVETAKKAKKDGVKQFIFMSSIVIFGGSPKVGHKHRIAKSSLFHCENIYAESKLMAEEGIGVLAASDFLICIIRSPMIYGPNCKGNYAALAKAATRLPVFPNISNERSMLYIGNLASFVGHVIDTQLSGICHPQNFEYVCTSNMVQEIAKANEKRIILTRAFNPLIKLLSGRVKLIDRIFGNLTYDKEDSEQIDDYDFERSIRLSEGKNDL